MSNWNELGYSIGKYTAFKLLYVISKRNKKIKYLLNIIHLVSYLYMLSNYTFCNLD